MKRIKLLLAFAIITNFGYSQLEQYESYLTPYLTAPMESGYFIFKTPNVFTPGSLFTAYKAIAPDANNSMMLINTHMDSLKNLTHYKYQQTYKGIPIEGAGCIEHVDKKGMMLFINAKLTNLNLSNTPGIEPEDAVYDLIKSLKGEKLHYAWLNSEWEQQIRTDMADSSATFYPTAQLLYAIDTLKDMHYVIDSTRYRLAYKIRVVTIEDIKDYYVDAITNDVFRAESAHVSDGPADVYGYGSRIIDTQWEGGFTQKWTLHANDDTRRIHTKKYSTSGWGVTPNIKDADDNWGGGYLTETSTHYFVAIAWDYYRGQFSRTGMNNDAIEVRVKTQIPDQNAFFSPANAIPELQFGHNANSWDYGMDPSVVGHEFTHGVNNYTAGLGNQYESGALNESFGDIFGVVIQCKMLDGGSTDWIMGNSISTPTMSKRSLQAPKTMGSSFDSGDVIQQGQPDTYGGQYWYSGTTADNGGVHGNGGVQNHWFYILSQGETGTNDLANFYNVNGIGMTKASQIAYYALTSILMSSSQYSDSRQATVQAAKILFGECSIEHQATMDAWYAVGIGGQNNCAYTLSTEEITNEDAVLVYPNPASTNLTIEVPFNTNKEIYIYDVSGKLVKTIINDKLLTQCDISSFDNGMYTILFNLNGNVITKKIIVQK